MSQRTHDLLPWHLLRAVDPSPRRALENARWAAGEIARAVQERIELTSQLDQRPVREGPQVEVRGDEPVEGGRELVTLTRDECLRLLNSRRLGRLAFVYRGGVPLVLPVNYAVEDDAIVIHSGQGPKLQAAERGDMVSFEVDDIDEQTHEGWSVLVTGPAELVRGSQHFADPQATWAPGPRVHVIRIATGQVSGRWLVSTEKEETRTAGKLSNG